MDLFFFEPDAVPLPPDQVRIKDFQVKPRPDNRRIRVYLEITPFQKRPNGEITITDGLGNLVASISFIETIDPKMEFTLHLRTAELTNPFTVLATLFYTEEPERAEDEQEPNFELAEKIVVDQAQLDFELTEPS